MSCQVKYCKNEWEFEDSGTEFVNLFCEKHANLAQEKGYTVFFDDRDHNQKFILIEK